MIPTFLTVVSAMFVVYYIFTIGVMFWLFSRLSLKQRDLTKIELNPVMIWLFLLSVAWLITKFFV